MKEIFSTLLISGVLAVCSIPMSAQAYLYEGSNLDFTGYPEFNPTTPYAPYTKDEYNYNNYKNDVERYEAKAKEYLENADNDIKRIIEAKQEAVEKANRVVEEFNDWASRKY